LTAYERTFETPAGNESVQRFENSVDGKNRKLATLKAYYAHAYAKGWMKRNLSEDLDLWKDEVYPAAESLSKDDWARFYAAITEGAATEHGQTYQERVALR